MFCRMDIDQSARKNAQNFLHVKDPDYYEFESLLILIRIVRILPPANEVCEGYVFTGVCLPTGGMCGRGRAWQGACMAGGVRGRGAYMAHPQQILRDTVNERAVRILLECILVKFHFNTLVVQNEHLDIPLNFFAKFLFNALQTIP